MKDTLKSIGSAGLALTVFAAVVVLLLLLIHGAVWLSAKLLPVLSLIAVLTFAATVFVLVPMAVFRPTRGAAGVGLYISSYVFGAVAWMTSLLVVATLWGVFGVVVGLCLAGVGIVPLALVALLFKGLWASLFELLFGVALTIGTRLMAVYVLAEEGREQERAAESPTLDAGDDDGGSA